MGNVRTIKLKSTFFGYNSAIDRPKTGGEPAYDYSVHIIRDGKLYRMYSGGRWRSNRGDGDHVLQHVSKTGAAGTWSMPSDHPEFWNGAEDGHKGTWYENNCLEPEVLKVKGQYYMYTQDEIDSGCALDIPGLKAAEQTDRIQLLTSPDGSNWKRFSERGVVVNLEDPTRTFLHHQELIYVPWDRDHKPFWLYVAVNVRGQFLGYVRIRSADPKTFDWKQREAGAGFAQIGNQTGYAKQAPGGPLFVRITFTEDNNGRYVPTLQFSRDGMKWTFGDDGPVKLDGSKDNNSNKNCYFLGISTIDGTGELEYLGNNTFRAIYGATTSNSPGGAEIWHSEVGVGELVFTVNQ
jgi:hypothetical protein